MFSYSPFLAKEKIIDGPQNKITLLSKKIHWIISSPLEDHIRECAENIYQSKTFDFCGNSFRVSSIFKINAPEFSNRMKFICLSPISVIKNVINQRKNYIFYDYNENISPAINIGLLNKYEQIYHCRPDDGDIHIKFDENYVDKRNGRVMKLLNLVEPDGFARKVKGIFAPFDIKGPPELIKLAYYTGFGDFTSFGMGLADMVSSPTHILTSL